MGMCYIMRFQSQTKNYDITLLSIIFFLWINYKLKKGTHPPNLKGIVFPNTVW